jgi:hypothetical protein
MAIKTSIARWVAGSAVAAIALWSFSALAVTAPVPATLTQQGRILASDGTPVSSKVAITFTLYNDATKTAAANVLWTETQNITLDDGYFSAQLGAVTALDPTVFDGTVLYLGVTVGSDAEMTPRQAITSVPYAFKAGVATTAASAASVPFTGLTGIPALCPVNQYLKGYNADGTAACGSLSCAIRSAASTGSVTSEAVACNAGETMTGGGCVTTGGITASYQGDICNPAVILGDAPTGVSPAISIICINGTTRKQVCNTASAAAITAYATCCSFQ